jgi:glycosyltransferase domain-containing protein
MNNSASTGDPSAQVSILVPTHNRHAYLARLLDYYHLESFRIVIADSSETRYNGPLGEDVRYFHLPGHSMTSKLSLVMDQIDTPYMLMCADDDFIIPAAIHTCVQFLSGHPSFSVAMGNVICYLRNSIDDFRLEFAAIFPAGTKPVIEEEDPLTRLDLFFSGYHEIFYAVHRTENLRQGFRGAGPVVTQLYLNEYLTVICPLLKGKFIELPVLYHVREYAPDTGGRHAPNVDAIFTDELYAREYENFLTLQSSPAAAMGGLDKETVRERLDLTLRKFAGELRLKKQRGVNEEGDKKVGRLLQRLPFVGKLLIREYRHWKIRRKLRPFIRTAEDRHELARIKAVILKYKAVIWP